MNAIKTLFGLDLPTEGTVVGKAIDEPRSINYQGVVGVQTINRDPIYWLQIKAGKKKARWVQVTKREYDRATIGGGWKR